MPLIALAIPSVIIGFLTVGPVLFGGYFGKLDLRAARATTWSAKVGEEFHGAALSGAARLRAAAVLACAAAGVLTAWVFFLRRPELADAAAQRFSRLQRLLVNKYYFDWINENIIAPLTRGLGTRLVAGRRPGASSTARW